MSVAEIKSSLTSLRSSLNFVYEEHAPVIHLWIAIGLISAVVSTIATQYSTLSTRADVVAPLIIGVMLLFAITFTVAIVGTRVAAARYSYRDDAPVLRYSPIAIHFSPHLLAIFIGIGIVSTGRFDAIPFFTFVISSSIAILSIVPFLQWCFASLTPERVLRTYLREIDPQNLEDAGIATDLDRSGVSAQLENGWTGQRISSVPQRESDPVDAIGDIVRSRIQHGDTIAAKGLLELYVRDIPSKIEEYRENVASEDEARAVVWHLFGPLESSFRMALRENNESVAVDIVALLRTAVEVSTAEGNAAMRTVSVRLFGRTTNDFLRTSDGRPASAVGEHYRAIARCISSEIGSGQDIPRNFVADALECARESVEVGHLQPARSINHGLCELLDATIGHGVAEPAPVLRAIGSIGEKFANQAHSRRSLESPNRLSPLKQAEWSISTLVSAKQEIEGSADEYASKQRLAGMITDEIVRINRALEARDRALAKQVDEVEESVVEVIRATRLTENGFTPDELTTWVHSSIQREKIPEICDSLAEVGALEKTARGSYRTAYE